MEESDDMNILLDMQNSIYKKKDDWWNGANGGDHKPKKPDPKTWQYQGWNEVAFDANVDFRDNKGKLEALVVALPTGFESLCDFDKDAVQMVDEILLKYWTDGYGHTPVVIMKTIDDTGNGKYQKETFVQSFKFASGRCIKDNGSKTLFYIGGKGSGC